MAIFRKVLRNYADNYTSGTCERARFTKKIKTHDSEL